MIRRATWTLAAVILAIALAAPAAADKSEGYLDPDIRYYNAREGRHDLPSADGVVPVPYGTGFEAHEGYALGDLNGQMGWVGDPYSTEETIVQDAGCCSGAWAAEIIADGNYDGVFHYGIEQWFDAVVGPSCDQVTISLEMLITAVDEADYLVSAWEGYDFVSAWVRFAYEGDIYVLETDTGYDWTPNTWANLSIQLDFAGAVSSVAYDGQLIADRVAFVDPSAGFDNIWIATDDYVESLGSSMRVDDVCVTPEPATCALLAVGSLALLRLGRRD